MLQMYRMIVMEGRFRFIGEPGKPRFLFVMLRGLR